jgi:CysZ protein
MGPSLAASFQGFADLFSETLFKLLLASVAIAACLLGGAVWAVTEFVVPLIPDWQGRLGGLAETAASGFAIVLTFVIALVLWPLVAMIVSGLFFDVAANRLEAKLLPADRRGTPPSALEGLLAGLRFAAVSLPLNMLAIPLYLIPGVNLIVAIALNAFLLSRENYMLAELRYGALPQAQQGLRVNRFSALLAALPGATLCVVPLVSFIVPLWTLATMVRLRALHNAPKQNGGTV